MMPSLYVMLSCQFRHFSSEDLGFLSFEASWTNVMKKKFNSIENLIKKIIFSRFPCMIDKN